MAHPYDASCPMSVIATLNGIKTNQKCVPENAPPRPRSPGRRVYRAHRPLTPPPPSTVVQQNPHVDKHTVFRHRLLGFTLTAALPQIPTGESPLYSTFCFCRMLVVSLLIRGRRRRFIFPPPETFQRFCLDDVVFMS